MLWLKDAIARKDVGQKAETLARAQALGLPVLDGVVVLPGEAVNRADLSAALKHLGGAAFAVRSSSAMEDRSDASAAGVFESVVGARGLTGVIAAIARVRASAQGEAAEAYFESRGLQKKGAMAVLVQPVVSAELLGVARSFAGDERFLVEERPAGEPEWGDVVMRRLHRMDPSPLAVGLRTLQQLVGDEVDVEFARTDEQVTFLQARRLVSPQAVADPDLFHVPGHWRLDAEHNPDPLSAAQAGLVHWVNGLGVGARQEVFGGYLYISRTERRAESPIPMAELARRFDAELAPEFDRHLAIADGAGTVEAALDAFGQIARRYLSEVTPTLGEARRALRELLVTQLGEDLPLHGELLAGLGGITIERDQCLYDLAHDFQPERLAEYMQRFGAYAPAWDVAVACDDEVPERVLHAAERFREAPAGKSPRVAHQNAILSAEQAAAALVERMDRGGRKEFARLFPLVRGVLPLAENDDLYFYRAQRLVRRALIKMGNFLAAAGLLEGPDEVFDLALDTVRQAEKDFRSQTRLVYRHLHDQAQKGRAARLKSARTLPPISIDDAQPHYATPPVQNVLRGHGTRGKARGPAVVLRNLQSTPQNLRNAVLVVPAMVPSVTHLLPGIAALVTDHGGTTSHGATLAREYDIPAVLGAGRATQIESGTELYVDADAGRVYVLGLKGNAPGSVQRR